MSYIKIDKTRTYQPYFQAYAKKLKHGDVANVHEYIAWITTKHREFRKLKELGRKPYTKEQEKQFIEFINQEESA